MTAPANVLKREWRGYNSSQATKEDLLNVCEVLDSVLRGQKIVYRAKDFRVPELRTLMHGLLINVAKKLGTDFACPSCNGTGRQPLHSEGTTARCVPCQGRGTVL